MAKVLDSLTLPIKKNGVVSNETIANNPLSIAGQFSTNTAYAEGQYIYNDKKLYRFTTDHAAGAWTGSDVEEVTVGGQLKILNEDTTELKQDFNHVQALANAAYVTETITDAAVASFTDGADDVPVKSLTVDITPVQSGSGDPSPSNVRPISGWTRSEVYDCGKNLICMTLDVIKSANTNGTWNGNIYTANGVSFDVHVDANGYVTEIIVSGHSTAASGYWTELILGEICVKSGTTYKISTGTNGSTSTTYRLWTNSTKAFPSGHRLSTDSNLGENIARDALVDERFTVQLAIYSNYTAQNLVIKPMVYLGTITDTTFEPYKGRTYSITFPTSAGTVYGGTLDVTSGVLTVDKGYYTLTGSETWTAWGSDAFYSQCLPSIAVSSNYLINCISSMLVGNAANEIYSGGSGIGARGGNLYINASEYANIGTYTGMQVVYNLDTYQTYQLTPTVVATILGQNNIFADTGNINELTYRADLKAYIDAHVGS